MTAKTLTLSAGNDRFVRLSLPKYPLFTPVSLKRADREAGFSLLEIMTVLVIIGVMSAAVVLSLNVTGPDEENAADKFVFRINQVAKDSIYSGKPNALSLSEEGLHLMSFSKNEWAIVHGVTLPERFKATLEIDDEVIRDLPEEPAPLILFEPTGEITDFTLSIDGGLSLFRADDGTIKLGRPQ